MRQVIGIDFGTTNSLVAWLDGDRPTIIPNARGARATPSVVAVTAKGATLVGESAKNQSYINPANTIVGVKRLLGSEGHLSMGGKTWRPEEIVALLLGSLKRDAERHLSAEVTQAAVCAPAHFSDRERRALCEAGRLAGLEILRIVNEPTAAALAYSWQARLGEPADAQEGELLLVYDFGGGTFDVTLLERKGIDCRVLSSRGDGRLGGADLDRELKRLAARSFSAQGLSLEADPYLAQQLSEASERAKIELSEREESAIALAFAAAGGKVIHPSLELSRSSFEDIARPYVERSLDLVEKAIADAGLSASDIDSLVLSGGSSRIPLVKRLLSERLGLAPEGAVNPEEIVALGSAVVAALSTGSGSGRMRVRDVVSRSFGVEVDGGVFVPLVRKNSPVPSSRSRVFTTVVDDQESVEIHVLQGESLVASEDLSLGRFLLAGIKPAKAGQPRVRVDFAIDESDMLHVSALDLESGTEQTISIADLGRGGTGADEPPALVASKASLLAGRIAQLRSGIAIERGLEAELDEIEERARRMLSPQAVVGEGELRMLKAELEGLVGELLSRRAEARSEVGASGDARRA